jgi:hypothetical protein
VELQRVRMICHQIVATKPASWCTMTSVNSDRSDVNRRSGALIVSDALIAARTDPCGVKRPHAPQGLGMDGSLKPACEASPTQAQFRWSFRRLERSFRPAVPAATLLILRSAR